MAELPEVAWRRLSRLVEGGDHPDAGLLTAFVEGTLPKPRRDGVFGHLVACSECNRLVALIAPEREVTTALQPAEVRRRWFGWIPARWAGAAVTATVVVSAVLIGRIGQQTKVPPAPSAAVERAPSLGLTAQLPVVQPDAPRPTNNLSQRAPSSRQVAKSAAVSPQPPSAQVNAAIAAQSRPAASDDIHSETAFQTSMMSSVPIEPIWRVSDPGVLQKSGANGHTWVAVAVPSRVPLRVALSVLGQDIWTGGDQGALYHSTDAGQTWTAVVPTLNGAPLSADIVRIAFSDLQHGQITTRSGEIWTTRDRGATWSLQ